MFSEVIVAIYETDEDAQHAVADMLAANVPPSAIQHHTQADDPPAPQEGEPGFWARLFGGHHSDHAVYDHAMRNGGNVVTVTTVPDHDFGPVMEILERHNPIDVDEQAVSFTGIAHSPDPEVSGQPLSNQGGSRVRRFARPPGRA